MIFKRYGAISQADFESKFLPSYNNLIGDLNAGLGRLAFKDNFQVHEALVTIASGADAAVPHSLGVIPKYRLIVRQQGNGLVIDSATDWTENNIYLRNEGPSTVSLTVLIFK